MESVLSPPVDRFRPVVSNVFPEPRQVVLFPFMSKGHTIPIFHLGHLLLNRRLAVTVFTTPANHPFIAQFLSNILPPLSPPFPQNVLGHDDIPVGTESTDKLPSMSLFHSFVLSTMLMQPDFKRALETLPRVSFMVTDWFLWWTAELASRFNIPRFIFSGMCYYAMTLCRAVMMDQLLFGPYPVFVDYWNLNCSPKSWFVGPLCQAELPKAQPEPHKKLTWVQWLDEKLDQGNSVLYVAFGSQVKISPAQLKEIKIIVRDWVDQKGILMHGCVQGFLSHCGWKSVLESICAGVPILAWPMMAEQHLNARMVTEEIKAGLRIVTCDGSTRGFEKSDGLEKTVRQLMEGEMGKGVRKKVKELAETAKKAVEEGGSSWRTLDLLIDEITCMQ
ncbi:hypothetical protein I3843_03G032800 [Carya illinoinensis]|nr:hypothetical protein I3843_03G032800 [Carya illinoinensis]